MTQHLAQLNVARMRAPLVDPIMTGFVAQIDRINAAAEATDGFVWRLEMPDPEACALRVFGEPHILVNMSVWTSIDALRHYVYGGAHAGPLRDRTRWFLPMEGPTSVLWWVSARHRPRLEEGKARLACLVRRGPTARAFTFTRPFPPPVTATGPAPLASRSAAVSRRTATPHQTRRLTRARLLDGVEALSAADPDRATVVARFGPPPLWARRPGYATLVQIVLEQQISLAAARATFGRLRAACGEVTPERFARLTESQVRSAGVTRQKTSYCLGIARQIVAGTLDLRCLGRADDHEARRRLVEIRGIGPWTADIYLLMALGRPDIWPDGDLALATAAQQVKRLRRRPDTERLRRLSSGWAPWRAVAARVLWHHYLSTRGRHP